MEKQNVTLSLPKALLKRAKRLAIDHDTSLSGLMIELLTEAVEHEDQYMAAKRRQLALLAEGLELGTEGYIEWDRESLHER